MKTNIKRGVKNKDFLKEKNLNNLDIKSMNMTISQFIGMYAMTEIRMCKILKWYTKINALDSANSIQLPKSEILNNSSLSMTFEKFFDKHGDLDVKMFGNLIEWILLDIVPGVLDIYPSMTVILMLGNFSNKKNKYSKLSEEKYYKLFCINNIIQNVMWVMISSAIIKNFIGITFPLLENIYPQIFPLLLSNLKYKGLSPDKKYIEKKVSKYIQSEGNLTPEISSKITQGLIYSIQDIFNVDIDVSESNNISKIISDVSLKTTKNIFTKETISTDDRIKVMNPETNNMVDDMIPFQNEIIENSECSVELSKDGGKENECKISQDDFCKLRNGDDIEGKMRSKKECRNLKNCSWDISGKGGGACVPINEDET